MLLLQRGPIGVLPPITPPATPPASAPMPPPRQLPVARPPMSPPDRAPTPAPTAAPWRISAPKKFPVESKRNELRAAGVGAVIGAEALRLVW